MAVEETKVLRQGSWHLLSVLDGAPGLAVMAETLADLRDEGYPIVAGTADLKYSNGLVGFERRHPDRFVQFGISEQNMVTAAAGLAAAGELPYVATFASFLALLCCEQIRTDIAYTDQPVRLIGHHAGIALGFYGTSHHATEDLAITRAIAGLAVIAPADGPQLGAALRATVEHPGPIYFRIGRGRDPELYAAGDPFTLGAAIEHFVGAEATVVATGSTVQPSFEAVRALRERGHDVGLLAMPTIKPFDDPAILAVAGRCPLLISVEEHSVIGGLGGAIAEALTANGARARLARHGLHDEYSQIGPPTHLYRHYRLDAAGIGEVVEEELRAGSNS